MDGLEDPGRIGLSRPTTLASGEPGLPSRYKAARIELVGWLPSLSIEGDPPSDQLTGPDDAPFAVITAGHFAARAGLPPLSPTSRARVSQLMQLQPSLPWACRLVGLDPPVAP
jgi:hypothetical protein